METRQIFVMETRQIFIMETSRRQIFVMETPRRQCPTNPRHDLVSDSEFKIFFFSMLEY